MKNLMENLLSSSNGSISPLPTSIVTCFNLTKSTYQVDNFTFAVSFSGKPGATNIFYKSDMVHARTKKQVQTHLKY